MDGNREKVISLVQLHIVIRIKKQKVLVSSKHCFSMSLANDVKQRKRKKKKNQIK